jgi:cation diffusion facilitator family transporter
MAEESKGTVALAITVNAVIAIAKFAGGVISGSSALLSEGAHSVADTMNEAFLLTSLGRSSRPPDEQHPFGYGKERFFWSLLAAVGIFVLGAGFSFLEAYESFTETGGQEGGFIAPYIILGIAFLAEGSSWTKAMHQLRGEAARSGRSIRRHVRMSSDPTVKTVAAEDSAALIGLVVAFLGILLNQLTGEQFWQGIASALIGITLAVVAYFLARDNRALLIGEAADPRLRGEVQEALESYDEVDQVVDLLTMQIGAHEVLLAVRLDLAQGLSSDDVEQVSARIDRELRERFPAIQQVFLDATRADERVERVGLPGSDPAAP